MFRKPAYPVEHQNRYDLIDRIYEEVASLPSATSGIEFLKFLEDGISFWNNYVERPAGPLSDPHEVWIDFLSCYADVCTLSSIDVFMTYKHEQSEKNSFVMTVVKELNQESPYHPQNVLGKELGDYFEMIDNFDSYYAYSDDNTVWRAGVNTEKKIEEARKQSPEHQKLYDLMMVKK